MLSVMGHRGERDMSVGGRCIKCVLRMQCVSAV